MEKVTIDEFNNKLQDRLNKIQGTLPKAMALCCERIRSTALNDMAKTPRNTQVSYGKKNHHPSLPGNAPAPDTGNLRASIHYTVRENNNITIGIVGTDVEYGKILEYGTSRIAPRPWLKPAMDKNESFIQLTLKKAIKESAK